MLETEARRNHNAKALGLGGSHVTKGGDYIDDNDGDHKEDMQQLLDDSGLLQHGHLDSDSHNMDNPAWTDPSAMSSLPIRSKMSKSKTT